MATLPLLNRTREMSLSLWNDVQTLLARGENVDQKDSDGNTPLIRAAKLGDTELIDLLLNHNANINCTTAQRPGECGPFMPIDTVGDSSGGNTALKDACRTHQIAAVKKLLEKNCDVNKANDAGNTALHTACHSLGVDYYINKLPRGCPELVQVLLVQPNCDINQQNRRQETALHWTIRGLGPKQVGVRCSPDTLMNLENAPGFLEIVQMLLKAGIDVATKNEDGESPLTSFLKVMKIVLVDHQCDQNIIQKMFCDCLALLLSAGSSPDDRDFELMEPLHQVLALTGVKDYATRKCGRPSALRRLCKLTVRSATQKPLAGNLALTGLPEYLQKYVLLEVAD